MIYASIPSSAHNIILLYVKPSSLYSRSLKMNEGEKKKMDLKTWLDYTAATRQNSIFLFLLFLTTALVSEIRRLICAAATSTKASPVRKIVTRDYITGGGSKKKQTLSRNFVNYIRKTFRSRTINDEGKSEERDRKRDGERDEGR